MSLSNSELSGPFTTKLKTCLYYALPSAYWLNCMTAATELRQFSVSVLFVCGQQKMRYIFQSTAGSRLMRKFLYTLYHSPTGDEDTLMCTSARAAISLGRTVCASAPRSIVRRCVLRCVGIVVPTYAHRICTGATQRQHHIISLKWSARCA